MNSATNVDLSLKRYEACFAAGTLVHTKEGLVPIEQIKVGDWVLSKHESGEGERDYKRVTKTFVHENQPIISLGYMLPATGGVRGGTIRTTPNHPFWVEGRKWKEASTLKRTIMKAPKLQSFDDTEIEFRSTIRVLKMEDPDHGWLEGSGGIQYASSVFDFKRNTYVAGEPFYGTPEIRRRGRVLNEYLYRMTVYNIEVEDFHTYYVGKDGIWVHNKNIAVKPEVDSSVSSAIKGHP